MDLQFVCHHGNSEFGTQSGGKTLPFWKVSLDSLKGHMWQLRPVEIPCLGWARRQVGWGYVASHYCTGTLGTFLQALLDHYFSPLPPDISLDFMAKKEGYLAATRSLNPGTQFGVSLAVERP